MLNKLGKTFLFLIVMLPLSASVEMHAPDHVMEGEALHFQIIARGFNVKIPPIKSIEGYSVENTETSEETIILNTRRASKVTKTYRIFPKKSITIPAFTIEVDQKDEKTKNKKIRLQKITKTISDHFDLQMHLNKRDAYSGEEVVLTVIFAYKNVEDYSLPEVTFPGLLLKELSSKTWIRADGYSVEEIRYTLRPQTEGKLTLSPLKAEAEVRKGGDIQRVSIYSNELLLNVKALPKGVSLFGAYQLDTRVDTQRVNAGEAVELILTIEGSGNLDTLDDLDLDIPGTTLYVKSVQKHQEKSTGVYRKVFEIISDKNYTIPAITLSYFDQESQRKKTIQSKAFDVEVIESHRAKNNSKAKPAKDEVSKKMANATERITDMERVIYFLIGVLSSIVFMLVYRQFKNKTELKKQPELVHELKQIKTQDALFKKIVPYVGRDRHLDRLIYQLEGKETANFKEIKKKIIQKVQVILC
ncbi:BatD family protein [Sulfurovum sp. TSL1]|uniref:BatD family protein n=1 Tax=Sulfurovum sp. TSL1 TaxID=2826994 RepID=UPI001CC34211|nr:BatD family protein [Sulfurovum sp. TSL1]GIT97209.1 hypothetical protein TSL1_00300 [Sulfurovum sp. TSL1]